MQSTREIAIPIRGPFELRSAIDFLGEFVPAAGTAVVDGERLVLGFRLDGTFEAVGVCVWQDAQVLRGEVVGSDALDVVAHQVARMLALDHDGTDYPAVGRRDAVIGELQARYHWLRAVNFASPYEAAVWGILAQRRPMAVAAKLKQELAAAHGDVVTIAGQTIAVAPRPETLARLESFPGLPAVKVERLAAIGEAAMRGDLDAARLRTLGTEAAIAELEKLPGVGPWTAGHIVVRGAATLDEVPLGEPRVHRAVAHAYGLAEPPTDDELEHRAAAWRPFRTWVTILVVVHLSRTGKWTDDADSAKRGRQTRKR